MCNSCAVVTTPEPGGLRLSCSLCSSKLCSRPFLGCSQSNEDSAILLKLMKLCSIIRWKGSVCLRKKLNLQEVTLGGGRGVKSVSYQLAEAPGLALSFCLHTQPGVPKSPYLTAIRVVPQNHEAASHIRRLCQYSKATYEGGGAVTHFNDKDTWAA